MKKTICKTRSDVINAVRNAFYSEKPIRLETETHSVTVRPISTTTGYYHANKREINDRRRREYLERKAGGSCVRCGEPAVKGSILCQKHREMYRKTA